MENLNDLGILDVSKSLTNKETVQHILMNFEPLLRTKIGSFNGAIKRSGIDSTSMPLLPWKFKEWVPLITPGDGNCLFNSVSMSLVDDTTLASLLRMLTAAELFAHSEFYAKHQHLEIFAKAAKYTLPSIVAIFLSHTKAENAKLEQRPQSNRDSGTRNSKTIHSFLSFHHTCPVICNRTTYIRGISRQALGIVIVVGYTWFLVSKECGYYRFKSG